MSKPNAPTRNNDQAATSASTETVAAAQLPDEHAGKGGMYALVDGRRVLVDRTEAQAPNPTAAQAD